jgi:ubiquinone/menaquinone biosynthesis C-methylase UbiE
MLTAMDLSIKLSQLATHIKAQLNKYTAYRKAYSGHFLWFLQLPGRERELNQVAIKAAQFSARGWILDIGTSYGYSPIEIARKCPGVQIVGIDTAPDLTKDANRRAKRKQMDARVSFLIAKAESLPFANNIFDTILSAYSLHLWQDQQSGITEIHRVLKPGGRGLILVGRQRLLHGRARITDYLTRKSITKMEISCSTAGFKEIAVENVHGIFHIVVMK